MSQTLAFTYCALDIHISSLLKKQSDHRHITSHHIKSHHRQEAKHTRAIRPSYCDNYNWMHMQYCPYNITHTFNYHIHIRTVKQPLYCTCCLYVPRSYVHNVCGETNLDQIRLDQTRLDQIRLDQTILLLEKRISVDIKSAISGTTFMQVFE